MALRLLVCTLQLLVGTIQLLVGGLGGGGLQIMVIGGEGVS